MTSQLSKLEQVLDLLTNNEIDQAGAVLHDVMVEKARQAYQNVIREEFEEDVDDFADEIALDQESIDSEENGDLEFDANLDGDFEVEDQPVADDQEARIQDLEAALADLMAQFDELVAAEDEELDLDDEEELDLDDEEELDLDDEDIEDLDLEDDEEELEESAKALEKPVRAPKMKDEGKLSGTGRHSKTGATGKESTFTRSPSRTETKGRPVDFASGDEKGPKVKGAKDETITNNTDVKTRTVGKVKNDTSAGNTDSVLGSKGSPRGGK